MAADQSIPLQLFPPPPSKSRVGRRPSQRLRNSKPVSPIAENEFTLPFEKPNRRKNSFRNVKSPVVAITESPAEIEIQITASPSVTSPPPVQCHPSEIIRSQTSFSDAP